MYEATKTLSAQDALILQQLGEVGEDQLDHMTVELHDTRGHLLARINSLRKKGLVKIISHYDETIISLTTKGRRTIQYIWPEARSGLAF